MSKTKSLSDRVMDVEEAYKNLYTVVTDILDLSGFRRPVVFVDYDLKDGNELIEFKFYEYNTLSYTEEGREPFHKDILNINHITLDTFDQARKIIESKYKMVDVDIPGSKMPYIRMERAVGDILDHDNNFLMRALMSYINRCCFIFAVNYYLHSKDVYYVLKEEARVRGDDNLIKIYKELGYK